MESDIVRWNEKYSNHRYSPNITPSPLLIGNRSLFSGEGTALDLASGVGDNALFLASLGYEAFALDGSTAAMRIAKQKAGNNNLFLNGFVADLDTYPIPKEYFDVILVLKYLNRGLIDSIKQSLKPGGLLLFETFSAYFLEQKPAFPKEYVLRDGELTNWFGNWHCVATNDFSTDNAPLWHWIGSKT